jgi:hypothetical protein
MPSWVVWAVAVALANLAILVLIRGRWTRRSGWLALASLGGAIVGNLVAGRTGLEVVVLGGFHVLAASIGAQLAMWILILLAAAAPARRSRGTPPGSPQDADEADR